jgi:Domain of unknown function (DUF4407)
MKRFFLFCSGANISVLEECPTEESKYVGIGATILLTALFASFAGGYALLTVFRSTPAAVVFGLLWGAVIFNLDRVIVSGMRKQNHFALDLLYAAPRFAISFLLAVVISRPLELRLFDVEIREKWERMQIDARNTDVERIEAGDSARLNDLRRSNEQLNRDIELKREAYNAANDAWLLEKAGKGVTGIPGAGPVFREYEVIRSERKRQLDRVEIQNRRRIARNDSIIASIEAEQQETRNRTSVARAQANGFLARMEAFGVLKEESRTVHLAGLFITLLFIALETAPVVVKLLSTLNPYRPYDTLLEQREREAVEGARVRRETLRSDTATELRLNEDKNRLRRETERDANEVLMNQVAAAQVELAKRVVEEWKLNELAKIENGLGEYVQRVP